MEFLLQSILSSLDITAIVFSDRQSYRELSVICYKYISQGRFFKIICFCTAAWIGPTPYGPVVSVDGRMLADTLDDIATVEEYKTLKELKLSAVPTAEDIRQWYKQVDDAALARVKKVFATHQEAVIDATFTFLPMPSTIVSLKDSEGVLGTVVVSSTNEVSVIMAVSPSIYDFVDAIKVKALESGEEVVI